MAMPVRTCDILTYALLQGDATSEHTFELSRVLAQIGIRPAIFSNYPPHDLPADIRPIARQASCASYEPHADLTILQYPLWFPLAERFRAARGARLFWYHGVTPPEHWPVPEERDLLRTSQVRTELAHQANLAVVASPFTAAELREQSAYPAGRIRVVPLGVDIESFSATPEALALNQLRSRWRLNGKRVLLYVGRIAGNKRLDVLIDALARLAPEFPDLHLLIVGDDGGAVATQVLTASLRRRAEEHGLSKRISFTGRVPDVKPYYYLANAFVQPSQHEGFGVPLVEAMAAGVPVIASASGAMPWLLNAGASDEADNDTAGLLFVPGNAESLAETLRALLVDEALCARLVQRGQQRSRQFDRRSFRTRAALAIAEAIEMHAAGVVAPEAKRERSGLFRAADTVLRDYAVASRLPFVGKHIARGRAISTVHFKEAYFDRVMEQQVSFNRSLSGSVELLEQAMTDAGEAIHRAGQHS